MISVTRAFNLIQQLQDSGEGLSFNQLRRDNDNLSPTTLTRLLETLVEIGQVKKDSEGRYTLGDAFFRMIKRNSANAPREEIIKDSVEILANRTMESASFWQLEGKNKLFLMSKRDMPGSFMYREVGFSWEDLQRDAIGWPCLAYMKSQGLTVRLQKIISKIKDDGVVINEAADYKGVYRIASPVFCEKGKIMGSLAISFLERTHYRIDKSEMMQLVKEQALKISEQLKG